MAQFEPKEFALGLFKLVQHIWHTMEMDDMPPRLQAHIVAGLVTVYLAKNRSEPEDQDYLLMLLEQSKKARDKEKEPLQ
jgi:hypothetical protein